MSEQMTALDHIIQSERNDVQEHELKIWSKTVEDAATELAALRAEISRLSARADEEEKEKNLYIDKWVKATDIIMELEVQVAEQARALDEARKVLHDIDSPDWTLSKALRVLKSDVISPDETIWREWLTKQADAIDDWLAAHPAPQNNGHVHLSAGAKCVICGLPAPSAAAEPQP